MICVHTSNALAKCHISSTIWITHDVCKSVAAIYQYVFRGSGSKGARGCHTCHLPILRHRKESCSKNRQYIKGQINRPLVVPPPSPRFVNLPTPYLFFFPILLKVFQRSRKSNCKSIQIANQFRLDCIRIACALRILLDAAVLLFFFLST